MAIFTKEDRIEISKKLTNVAKQIQQAEGQAVAVDLNIVEKEKEDAPIKKLIEERDVYINAYQNELKLLDGVTRSELTEQIMLDSANRVLNNSFFPNDPASPLPSLPDGVWKNFVPFTGTHAIGKNNFEQFPEPPPVARTEQNIIDDINNNIALVEAESIPERATGLLCDVGGSCSGETPPGSGVDESTCTANGGTWTAGADTYSPSITQSLLTDIENLVQEWEDILNSEKNIIPFDSSSDPNSTRQSGNDAAVSDIDNSISIIDTWQAVQDFDTTTSLPTGTGGSGCSIFDALLEEDFEQAKLQPTTLQPLIDELAARTSYISTRESELKSNTYLGNLSQDLNNGEITAYNGLYGERMRFIDMRLNASGGTLTSLIGLQTAKKFTNGLKAASENDREALSLVMAASLIVAPGLGTKFLNIKDASQFNVGDRVYVVANDQEELSGSIVSKDGNRLELTFNVPKKYTLANQTRLYKLL